MRLGANGLGMVASVVLSFGLVLSVGACAGGDKEEVTEQVAPAPEGEAASEEAPAPAPEEKKDAKKSKKGDKKGHKKGDKKSKKKK